MRWITIILAIVSIIVCVVSCDDTDQSEKERSWTLQAQNSTPHEVVIQLFSFTLYTYSITEEEYRLAQE